MAPYLKKTQNMNLFITAHAVLNFQSHNILNHAIFIHTLLMYTFSLPMME